jgi:hypothetical protein
MSTHRPAGSPGSPQKFSTGAVWLAIVVGIVALVLLFAFL